MNQSRDRKGDEFAQSVQVTDETLSVELSNGRAIAVPLGWFPRLAHATRKERNKWRLIGRGQGIHWPLIDEDISVEGLLAGRPSGESQKSLKKWLAVRAADSTKRRTATRTGKRRARTRGHKVGKAGARKSARHLEDRDKAYRLTKKPRRTSPFAKER